MNSLTKAAIRFTSMKSVVVPLRYTLGRRDFTRTFWHMSKINNIKGTTSAVQFSKPSLGCTCGCGSHNVHTKAERELVEFLTEEIVAEKKIQKSSTLPAEVDGFKVKLDGSEVELTKTIGKEKVIISFNINHTVDTEEDAEVDPHQEKPEFGEMKSKPTFIVNAVKGTKTLSFTCSFLEGAPAEGEYNDVFGIDEFTIYDGEHNEKQYAVAGDVLDGYLYDLLMNLLEEKGISNEFVEKVSDFSTKYEQAAYIGLLESLSKFTTDN